MAASYSGSATERDSAVSATMKRLGFAFLLTTTLGFGACTPLYYVEDEAEAEVYAPDPPPEAREERVPRAPGRYYVWIPGRWAYQVEGKRYAWRPGVYRRIRHPQHRYWVSGAWRSTPRGYVWAPGHWR